MIEFEIETMYAFPLIINHTIYLLLLLYLKDIFTKFSFKNITGGRPCDFESGDICGFKVQSPDGITWRRMQAKRVKFGAKVDKTYGTSDGK